MADDERTPDFLGQIQPLSAVQYGDEQTSRDVNPAPLRRVLRAWLAGSNDLGDRMQAIASDDRDGPLHIVRLLAVVDLTSRKLGGTGKRGEGFPGHQPMAVSDIVVQRPELADAWLTGGVPAAVAVVRAMSPGRRYGLLELLMDLWSAPIHGLYKDPI